MGKKASAPGGTELPRLVLRASRGRRPRRLHLHRSESEVGADRRPADPVSSLQRLKDRRVARAEHVVLGVLGELQDIPHGFSSCRQADRANETARTLLQ